ncbi:MAG: hypothetical protein OQJ97_08310 [Rhodospirillales bacterium]|nr:hypothetical protein [Rhodospirillales bacterium]
MDDHADSPTDGTEQEITLDRNPKDYKLVTVPVGVWPAFACHAPLPC